MLQLTHHLQPVVRVGVITAHAVFLHVDFHLTQFLITEDIQQGPIGGQQMAFQRGAEQAFHRVVIDVVILLQGADGLLMRFGTLNAGTLQPLRQAITHQQHAANHR